MKKRLVLSVFCGYLALLGATSARADFIIDSNPSGQKFFIDVANHNVTSFSGHVGANNSGPIVDVATMGAVDTGSGFANIKVVRHSSLTTLTFTPEDPNLFGNFSFRGQLEGVANGTVTLTVQDAQGDPPQTFTFTGLGRDADFGRIGIIAVSGSGETIESVTISSGGFKEVKQIEFSIESGQGPNVTPEPASVCLLGLGGLGLFAYCGARYRRKARTS